MTTATLFYKHLSQGDDRRIKSQATEGTAQSRQHSGHWQARVKCMSRWTNRSIEIDTFSLPELKDQMPATAPKGKGRGQCSKTALETEFSWYLKGNVPG